MEYLNPHKTRRETIQLYIGYCLIVIAIVLLTIILVYIARGFGIKKGEVIQSGLVFFSSQPNPASINLSGISQVYTTDTRLELASGIYQARISRPGYRTWQRQIEVNGGAVEHFDYPLLVPNQLIPKDIEPYSSAPALMTQSPDHRWLLISQPASLSDFNLYDISSKTAVKTTFSLPSGLLTQSVSGNDNLQLVGWADDNTHLVVSHSFDQSTEYVLIDIHNPSQSLNLSKTLNLNASNVLSLDNLKYDHYYLYDQSTQTLATANLGAPTPVTVLSHVLAFSPYGSHQVLYITDQGAPKGLVEARLTSGNGNFKIKALPPGSSYVLDLTQYSSVPYVVVGSSSSNKVFIYQDPISQLASLPNHDPVPSQVLRIDHPSYVAFSANAQFIVAESGTSFGVYDVFNQKGYSYTIQTPLDAPQMHASWMDGNRLELVSGGKLVIFDYDHTNQQSLVKASPSYLPAYTPNYNYFYSLTPSPTLPGQFELTDTSLLIPSDQ